ncbi:hypothetical protein [Aeribacillus alveayuensis]|uniref:Tetratricopeptide repeat protein n=1 Tax=Aeribacillus alveayuensis TaxID=279215 RepID=A0ABT9VPB1_9BACI|nr:hypothetical protein [Bacillus alveayuensis]
MLFNAYVEMDDLKKAKQLLDRYPDDFSIHFVYNRLLLELLENGPTKKAEKLLKEAKKRNPHVIKYLYDGRWVDSSIPYFTPGDETEAIVYVQDSGHLWWDDPLDRLRHLL